MIPSPCTFKSELCCCSWMFLNVIRRIGSLKEYFIKIITGKESIIRFKYLVPNIYFLRARPWFEPGTSRTEARIIRLRPTSLSQNDFKSMHKDLFANVYNRYDPIILLLLLFVVINGKKRVLYVFLFKYFHHFVVLPQLIHAGTLTIYI